MFDSVIEMCTALKEALDSVAKNQIEIWDYLKNLYMYYVVVEQKTIEQEDRLQAIENFLGVYKEKKKDPKIIEGKN